MPKGKESAEILVQQLDRMEVDVYLVGESPLVMNSMSVKAKRGLLMPLRTGRMTTAEKAANLKHNPLEEFRESTYRYDDDLDGQQPTRCYFKASGFKQSIMTAALDTPGAKKAQIGRLLRVEGQTVGIYGIPQIWITGVKGADIARTPDMRTRAILPEWCAHLKVSYVTPNLRRDTVATLLGNAGEIAGIGDGRQEKGALDFGRWRLVGEKDAVYQAIVKAQGREAQDLALAEPAPYDGETRDLFEWFCREFEKRPQPRGMSSLNGDKASVEEEVEEATE